jgi:hypothetical protein
VEGEGIDSESTKASCFSLYGLVVDTRLDEHRGKV